MRSIWRLNAICVCVRVHNRIRKLVTKDIEVTRQHSLSVHAHVARKWLYSIGRYARTRSLLEGVHGVAETSVQVLCTSVFGSCLNSASRVAALHACQLTCVVEEALRPTNSETDTIRK